MEFRVEIDIARPVHEVFSFFRDIDQLDWENHPVVMAYQKLTPGPVRVGTRYLETIRMLRLIRFAIRSEIIALETDRCLAYRWEGPGMQGQLSYEFEPGKTGTHVRQAQTLSMLGWMQLFDPLVRRTFSARIADRLSDIKITLEQG